MDFNIFFVVFFASLKVMYCAPPVEISPTRITLLQGQSLQAMCRVGVPISYCRFNIPGVGGLNLSPKIAPHDGVQYHGSDLSRGECGVLINNVQEKHNGILSCNLGYNTEPTESTGNLTLVVAKPPNTPVLNVTRGSFSVDTYREGETIKAECRIERGRPVANITWFIGNKQVYDGLSSTVVTDDGNGQKTISQVITRQLKYTDHGKDLRCVAGHIALGPSNINHSIYKLNVVFPPKPPSREIEQFGFTIGQPGKVVVTFHANPIPQIEWIVDQHKLTEGARDPSGRFLASVLNNKGSGTWDAVLNIVRVTTEEVEKSYTLIAKNLFGEEKYKVAISTSPAPPADMTAGAIAGIVVAALLVLLLIFIAIFARATGRWCFAGGNNSNRQAGESKRQSFFSSFFAPTTSRTSKNVGSLTYRDYTLVESEDGKKSYVSPDEAKQRLVEKKVKSVEATFENEVEKQKLDRKSSGSSSDYEIPIHKMADQIPSELPKAEDLKTRNENEEETKPFDVLSEDGTILKMPPNIRPSDADEKKKRESSTKTKANLMQVWFTKTKKRDEENEESDENKKTKLKIFSNRNESENVSPESENDKKEESDVLSENDNQEKLGTFASFKIPNLFGKKPKESNKESEDEDDEKEKAKKINEETPKEDPNNEKDGFCSDSESDHEHKKFPSVKKLFGFQKKSADQIDEKSKDDLKSKNEKTSDDPSKKVQGFYFGKYFGNRKSEEEEGTETNEKEEKLKRKNGGSLVKLFGVKREKGEVHSLNPVTVDEMQQKESSPLEDEAAKGVDHETDKVSDFTGSKSSLASGGSDPEKEETTPEREAEVPPEVKIAPPLPANPPPTRPKSQTFLPVISSPQGSWGPKLKKSKKCNSGPQSEELLSSKSGFPQEKGDRRKEAAVSFDSGMDKINMEDEEVRSSWRVLDEGEGEETEPILKKKKKQRPVSFADNVATVMIPRSDTESADHGSADKSSVTKLTNEKQTKRPKLIGGLLDSLKKKSRDKVGDNEAVKGANTETNKDPEQLSLDGAKSEGIVYAELDIARSQGNVKRREDEKTEYAEIIHPNKTTEFKKSKEELRKSGENLSGSRELLTESEESAAAAEGKKEAAV